jgi:hypothetical protein
MPICRRFFAGADPGGGLADLLDGGEKQPDQDGDDPDHHEKLNQREAAP